MTPPSTFMRFCKYYTLAPTLALPRLPIHTCLSHFPLPDIHFIISFVVSSLEQVCVCVCVLYPNLYNTKNGKVSARHRHKVCKARATVTLLFQSLLLPFLLSSQYYRTKYWGSRQVFIFAPESLKYGGNRFLFLAFDGKIVF